MIYFLPILVLLLDQITKYFIVQNNTSIIVIPKLLEITGVYNDGVFFGLLQGINDIALIITLLIVVILAIYLYLKKNIVTIQKIGYLLILSGSTGNILDRLFRGAVIDFIYIPIIEFPVFNIADISICAGAVVLAVSIFMKEKKQ